jgi:hypothetical protein
MNYLYPVRRYTKVNCRKTNIDWKILEPFIYEASINKNVILKNIMNKATLEYNEIKIIPKTRLRNRNLENSRDVLQRTPNRTTVAPTPTFGILRESQNPRTQFWNNINSIRCMDKDEGRMTKRSMYIHPSKIESVIYMVNTVFIPELDVILCDILPKHSLSPSEYKNILAHIIFKKKRFFNGIKTCPQVSLYLLEQYYPIYQWLCSN